MTSHFERSFFFHFVRLSFLIGLQKSQHLDECLNAFFILNINQPYNQRG